MKKGIPTRRAHAASSAGSPDTTARNTFSALADVPYDFETLNEWAKTQSVAQASLPQKLKKEIRKTSDKLSRISNYVLGSKKSDQVESTFVIQSEKDVDKVAPMMCPLPVERKKICKMLQKVSEITLEPGERLCLVDSGSFTHAIDAEEHLPNFEITPLKESQLGKDGESASGEILVRQGKVRTTGTVDGMPLGLSWDVMKVKVPIVSVRKLVRDHFNVYFKKFGGFIKDLKTGNKLPFFEYQGVYYMKYRIDEPPNSPEVASGFAGPVP